MEGCRTCRAREIARWTDVLVLTEAAGGCTIYAGNACVHVSALPATPVDPTGAGDVFAAAFFIRFWETRDALVAADFATTAAGLSVTGRGLESVPDRQAILRLQSSRRSPSAVKSQTP
jgi:sugar/nucleoside kinase (ribokinase family)